MADASSKGLFLTSEDLRDELECPVCFKIPSSTPIYQCDQGHIHCKNCHPRLRTCPICRIPLSISTRALLAEKLLARLPMKCSYNGCEEVMMKDLLAKHEKDCPFRNVRCPVYTCHLEFPVNDIIGHVDAAHKVVRLAEGELSYIRKNFSMRCSKSLTPKANLWAPCHMRIDDEDFFAQVLIHDSNMYFWVYMVGHAEKAKDYHYTLKLFNLERKEEMQYQGPVASIDSLRGCNTHGSGLVLVPFQYKKFYTEDRKMNFEASIFAVSDQEEPEDHKVKTEELDVPADVNLQKRPAADQQKAGPSVAKKAKKTSSNPGSSRGRNSEMSEIVQSPQSPDPSPRSPDQNSNGV